MKSIFALLVVLITLTGASVAGQTPQRGQVFGTLGAHRLWDDESSIGTGIAFGGGAGYDISNRLTLRGRIVRTSNRRDFGNGVVFENDGVRSTAEVLFRFSDGPHAGYLGGGFGAFHNDHLSLFGPNPQDPRQPPAPVERFATSGNPFIYGAFGGFTAVSRGRFRLQPEVSLWLSEDYHFVIEPAVIAAWRF